MHDFHGTFRDLLHAANLRHGTHGFTSLPKEGALRIFFALKNPTASAGFEPVNLGTKGQHATPRPPKPLVLEISGENSTGEILHNSPSLCLVSTSTVYFPFIYVYRLVPWMGFYRKSTPWT